MVTGMVFLIVVLLKQTLLRKFPKKFVFERDRLRTAPSRIGCAQVDGAQVYGQVYGRIGL
jgi:hypothetical protein